VQRAQIALTPPFSTLTPTTTAEPASALTHAAICRSLLSRSPLGVIIQISRLVE